MSGWRGRAGAEIVQELTHTTNNTSSPCNLFKIYMLHPRHNTHNTHTWRGYRTKPQVLPGRERIPHLHFSERKRGGRVRGSVPGTVDNAHRMWMSPLTCPTSRAFLKGVFLLLFGFGFGFVRRGTTCANAGGGIHMYTVHVSCGVLVGWLVLFGVGISSFCKSIGRTREK